MTPRVKWGAVIISVISVFVLVASVDGRQVREDVAPVSNQTEALINNINDTGEFMKRAGEFASRVLWVKKRKFVFPSGTILTLAPKITVPAFRRKPFKGGLNSDIQATMFFYMYLDKMGWTDPMHPFPFDMPPFYPFGPLMRPIETKDEDKNKDKDAKKKEPMKQHHQMDPNLPGLYPSKHEEDTRVFTYFPIHKRTGSEDKAESVKPKTRNNHRKPRSVMSLPPPGKLHGGERAVMMPRLEEMMAGLGFSGRECMLRMICEVHEYPLQDGYGLLGEMISLFFSVSASPYAESHLPEYLKAEKAGRTGDCSAYTQKCTKSIFKWEVERKRHDEDDDDENEIRVSPYKSKSADYDEL